jgi:ABC-type nitrate/sulfonate/bicarbonate transport system permease component
MTNAPEISRDPRSRRIQVAFFAVVVSAWWIVTATHRISPLFLPGPARVLTQIGRIVHAPTLAVDIGFTAGTLLAAYVIAAIAGLTVGYLVSARRFLTRVYEPLLAGIYAVPIIVLFPTFILFFGIGPNSKIALGAVYAFFPIALNTISGFTQVDPRLVVAARSMGANDRQLMRRVLLPAAMPVVATGLRIAFIACFAAILAGEMIASDHGLGHQIAQSGQMMEIAKMFGYVALVVIAAYVCNVGISALENRNVRRA